MRKTVISILNEGLDSSDISFTANEIVKNISMLDSLHLTNKAWNQVNEKIVRNCFCYRGKKVLFRNQLMLLDNVSTIGLIYTMIWKQLKYLQRKASVMLLWIQKSSSPMRETLTRILK